MGGDRDDDGGISLSAQSDLLVTHKLDSYSNRESELTEQERIRKMES